MRNKNFTLVLIVALLFFISIGYSYLTSNLDVAGTVNISNSKWDVHFNNPVVTNYPAGVTSNVPTIKGTNNQEIEYEVTLNRITDSYDFTIDIVNGGDIASKIKNIQSKIKINDGEEVTITNSTLPSYLEYTIKYDDNSTLSTGQEIAAGNTKKLKVHIGFKSGIANDEYLQALGNTIKLKNTIEYVQDNV